MAVSETVKYRVLHETVTSSCLTAKRLVSQYHNWLIGIVGGGNGFEGSSVGTLQFLSWPKAATETTPAQQQQPTHSQAFQVYKTSYSVVFYSHLVTEKGGTQTSKTQGCFKD